MGENNWVFLNKKTKGRLDIVLMWNNSNFLIFSIIQLIYTIYLPRKFRTQQYLIHQYNNSSLL
jgi:hypothetical protein